MYGIIMHPKCGFHKLSHIWYIVSLSACSSVFTFSSSSSLSPSFSLPQAHCHYAVLNAFQSALQTAEVNDNNLAILRALCSLYAVFGIVQYSGEFTMVTNLTNTQSHCILMYKNAINVLWISLRSWFEVVGRFGFNQYQRHFWTTLHCILISHVDHYYYYYTGWLLVNWSVVKS